MAETMDVTIGLSYFFVFLQALTGLVLLQVKAREDDRHAIRIFAVLFLVNAAGTVVLTLPRESAIWLRSDLGFMTRLAQALDAPTGPLLFAFLAARSQRAWAPLATRLCIAWAIGMALVEFPFHLFLALHDTFFRAIPFYASLALAPWILASGRAWERWIGLALLTRALYWGTAGVLGLAIDGWGGTTHEFIVAMNSVALLVLLAASLASAVKFVRTSMDPSPGTTIVIVLIGPMVVMMETAIRASLPPGDVFWYGTIAIFNLLTLALVRPVLTLIGIERAWLVPVAGRAAIAAGIGAFAALLVATLQLGSNDATVQSGVQFGFGLCVGLLVLIALKAAIPIPGASEDLTGSLQGAAGQLGASAGGSRPVPGMDTLPPKSDKPHWQILLTALRGSFLEQGSSAVGEARLTQKALAAQTGLRVARISSLVKDVNETAESRLTAHAPGWRDRHRGKIEIIHQYRGIVEGQPGTWVYYRLTSLGEELAQATSQG